MAEKKETPAPQTDHGEIQIPTETRQSAQIFDGETFLVAGHAPGAKEKFAK